MLEQMSRLIADLSMNLGMVLSPRFERGVFDRLEMVHLSEGRLLLVLAIKSGLVKTMVMEVDSAITPGELDETSRAVNERLSGLSVAEIRDSVAERLREVSSGSPRLLRVLCDSALNLFRFQNGMDLHFGGAGNFIMQPEFNRKKKRPGRPDGTARSPGTDDNHSGRTDRARRDFRDDRRRKRSAATPGLQRAHVAIPRWRHFRVSSG